jgi:hypothetical protein
MNSTEKVILIGAVTAAVGAIVTVWLSNKYATKELSSAVPVAGAGNSGSSWTNAGANDNLSDTYQAGNPYTGPGTESSRTNFNGVIWARRFNKGGNPNAPLNYERSWAFQSATKNPYANGNNCTYAHAVNNATQDPTNQATSLVLGPGIAPNNPAA